jgi:hypothetical protein
MTIPRLFSQSVVIRVVMLERSLVLLDSFDLESVYPSGSRSLGLLGNHQAVKIGGLWTRLKSPHTVSSHTPTQSAGRILHGSQ